MARRPVVAQASTERFRSTEGSAEVADVSEVRQVMSVDLQRELLKHRGRWVAIDSNTIVAVGKSMKEVEGAARAQGHLWPRVYQVPKDDLDLYV